MFEIGNKVIYQGADKSAYKREGTVVSIEDKNGKPQLTVELDGGETFTAPIDDWSRKFYNSARVTSTNSVVANAVAAKNARLVPFDPDAVKPGDSVWYKGREFEYKGMRGTGNVLLADVFDGEEETVFAYDRNLKMAANAAYKLSSTEAKVGDRVKVVGALGTYVVTKVDGEWIEIKDADDGTPQGRVKARFATPVRNAIEPRTGVDKEIGDHIDKARQALSDAYYFCKKVGKKDVAAVVFKAAETLNRARW